MTGLSDSFQRPINYLRISITDRCDLRCIYCMPHEGIPLMPRSDILSYEEIHAIAEAAAELGISKVRLTGGEPLVRSSLVELVRMLAQINGIDDISLTTNGMLLKKYAAEFKEAGLGRVNVSLDSLKSDRFHQITRLGKLGDVLDGIEAARACGLHPVKVNMVVMRGINDDELLDFARMTIAGEWHVRFIELMPFRGGNEWFMPLSEVEQRLNSLGELEPCLASAGGGPAKYFRFPGSRGTVGFISPLSEHICIRCNRLRLTPDGRLRLCLLSDEEVDLRGPLRRGASPEELRRLIEEAVASKPEGHQLGEGIAPQKRGMAQIGG